jgi:hypothetical protein
MFRLEYINRNTTNKWEFIDNFKTEKEAHDNMKEFFRKHNFTSYYLRMMAEDDEGYKWYDFGSHSQFYRIKEVQ